LKWVDEKGKAHEDRLSDFGRISRQQDFLRRMLQSALRKGITNPDVARALIKSLQTEIVTESGFTVNDMMKFAGIMRDIDPKSIAQYQVQASRLIVSGNDVLQAVDSENMRAILKIFQGQAPLAGAPAQVIDTSTTTTAKATTTSGSTTTTTPSSGPTTSVSAGATTTVVGPAEIVKGDILPDKNVTC
jgi:anionic cell wall polymer biosynthesis LytR-Cps2A-Psr (LCP) family protein